MGPGQHYVIYDRDADQEPDLVQALRQREILGAGPRVAGRMVVGDDRAARGHA